MGSKDSNPNTMIGNYSVKGGSIDSKIAELEMNNNISYDNTGSIEFNSSQIIKLDDEEAKLVPEEIKLHEDKDNDKVLLNNRMRSKKRSEQMKKRLDKVSGEKFYFKVECGIENGEIFANEGKLARIYYL